MLATGLRFTDGPEQRRAKNSAMQAARVQSATLACGAADPAESELGRVGLRTIVSRRRLAGKPSRITELALGRPSFSGRAASRASR